MSRRQRLSVLSVACLLLAGCGASTSSRLDGGADDDGDTLGDASATGDAQLVPSSFSPTIYLLGDSGSWEAPQAVFVAALPELPHDCYTDGTGQVGTSAQIANGTDTEKPGGSTQFGYAVALAQLTAAQATLAKAIQACIDQRDLAYEAQASTTNLGGGDPTKSTYAWDFGDANADAQFDHVAGIGAAHLYEHAGVYTMTLTITNELGLVGRATTQVTIKPSTRTVTTVTNQAQFAAVVAGSGSNREIVLSRGQAFQLAPGVPLKLGSNDVVMASAGSGALPSIELPCAGATVNCGTFFGQAATNVHDVIEHVQLRMTGAASAAQGNMFLANGTNTVLYDVESTRDAAAPPAFHGPDVFVTINGAGTLLLENGTPPAADGTWQTDGLKGNFAFINGSHTNLYGNHVYSDATDSTSVAGGYNVEPAIRTCSAGISFVSIVGNDIGGFFGKANEITLRSGHNLYVGSNTILGGVVDVRAECTPLAVVPGEATSNVIVENNHLEDVLFELTRVEGPMRDVIHRNNVSHRGAHASANWPFVANDQIGSVETSIKANADFVADTFVYEPADGKVFEFFGASSGGKASFADDLFVITAMPATLPLFNMGSGASALTWFRASFGNAFLFAAPTATRTMSPGVPWSMWAGAVPNGGFAPDQAFDVAAGGLAGGATPSFVPSVEPYRPTSGAAFAHAAVNLAAPSMPTATTNTFGISTDLTGLPRPAFGAGPWAPGALQPE